MASISPNSAVLYQFLCFAEPVKLPNMRLCSDFEGIEV